MSWYTSGDQMTACGDYLFFPGYRTQITRLGSRHLHPPSYLQLASNSDLQAWQQAPLSTELSLVTLEHELLNALAQPHFFILQTFSPSLVSVRRSFLVHPGVNVTILCVSAPLQTLAAVPCSSTCLQPLAGRAVPTLPSNEKPALHLSIHPPSQ